jgi:bacterioferritin (cytochrome b1)
MGPRTPGKNGPVDARVVELLSYYRDAELHGATLLLRLMRMMSDDSDAQIKLTEHVADETRHAWLWTKRIADLGGAPVNITPGYQTRFGMRIIPHTLPDLLALTIVVEERSLARYREHAARPGVDATTRRVLEAVANDEGWHIAWMKNKLEQKVGNDAAARERIATMTERYRAIDREVYAELQAREQEAFGAPALVVDGDRVSPRARVSSPRASRTIR